jgi:hypothetical protein
MDVWLRPDNGNRDKLVPVLESLGVLSENIVQIKSVDFTQALAFHIDEPQDELTF